MFIEHVEIKHNKNTLTCIIYQFKRDNQQHIGKERDRKKQKDYK